MPTPQIRHLYMTQYVILCTPRMDPCRPWNEVRVPQKNGAIYRSAPRTDKKDDDVDVFFWLEKCLAFQISHSTLCVSHLTDVQLVHRGMIVSTVLISSPSELGHSHLARGYLTD